MPLVPIVLIRPSCTCCVGVCGQTGDQTRPSPQAAAPPCSGPVNVWPSVVGVTAGVTESRAVRHEVTLGGCVTTGLAERHRGVRGGARARPRSQARQRDEGRQLLPWGFGGKENQEPRQDCGPEAPSL